MGLFWAGRRKWADRWLRDLFGPLEYGPAGWVFAVRWEFWRTAMILFAVRRRLKRTAKAFFIFFSFQSHNKGYFIKIIKWIRKFTLN
jgi:hypothetical protein